MKSVKLTVCNKPRRLAMSELNKGVSLRVFYDTADYFVTSPPQRVGEQVCGQIVEEVENDIGQKTD